MKKNILALITLLCLSSPLHAEDIPCRVIGAPCYLKDVSVLRELPYGKSKIVEQLSRLRPHQYDIKQVYSAYSGEKKLYFYLSKDIDLKGKLWGYFVPTSISLIFVLSPSSDKKVKSGWVSLDQLDNEIVLLREKPSEKAAIVQQIGRLSYWEPMALPASEQKLYFYLRETLYYNGVLWGYFDPGLKSDFSGPLVVAPENEDIAKRGWAPLDKAFHDVVLNRTKIYIQGENNDGLVKEFWYEPNTHVYSIQKKGSVYNFPYTEQMHRSDWNRSQFENFIKNKQQNVISPLSRLSAVETMLAIWEFK